MNSSSAIIDKDCFYNQNSSSTVVTFNSIFNGEYYPWLNLLREGLEMDDSNINIDEKILIVKEFILDNKLYIFKKPLKINIKCKNKHYYIDYEVLGISIVEESERSALKSFYRDIAFLWRSYACNDNEVLSKGAIKLKGKLLDIFDKVQEVGV